VAENNSAVPAGGRGPGRPFQPGTSGNPGGHPRKLRELEAAIQDAHRAPQVLGVLEKLRELALAGDVHAAKVYLDRVAGPVRANDEEKIEVRAREMLDGAIAEARAKRDNRAGDTDDGGLAATVS